MNFEEIEPLERIEETNFHPADTTFNSLHDKGLNLKNELKEKRHELSLLISRLPSPAPKRGSSEYPRYQQMLQKIQDLKGTIAQTHDELMEILKNEEKINTNHSKSTNIDSF